VQIFRKEMVKMKNEVLEGKIVRKEVKKMKKLVIIALSLVLLASLVTSCAKTTPTAKKPTLGLVLSTLNNPFFVTLLDGAQEEAKTSGVTLIAMDSQNDSAKEASNIEDLISRKVDAILVNPTDADAVVPSIKKANDANIPVLTIDRGANGGVVVCHIASDNVAGGKMAAEFLGKALNGKGKVVELQGIAGTSAARDRGTGFDTTMASEFPDIQIIARQTADFDRAKGLSVFENILTAQPMINGVFAQNDEMVLGAIQAAEAAKRTGITFVGYDAVDDAIKAIKDGKLAATVQQQPAVMGKLGVETAVNILNGKTVDKFIPVPLNLVTKENAP
jgi:ribose transport system substrate-binding protein